VPAPLCALVVVGELVLVVVVVDVEVVLAAGGGCGFS